MNLFVGVLGMYIVYKYYDEKQPIRKYILIAGAINLIFFISQRLGFDPIFDKSISYIGVREGGFLGNGPRLMDYFALIIPFLPLPLVCLSPLLLFTLAKPQIIILAPVAIVILMRLKTQQYRVVFGVIVLLAIILLRNRILQSLAFRFNTSWNPILNLFFDCPFIGFGMGITPIAQLEVIGSSYLQFITGVGVLGVVWFGYGFKNIYKKIQNNIESMALISLAIIMTIEYPLELPKLWFTIIGIVTMVLIKAVPNVETI